MKGLGLGTVNREDPEIVELMKLLGGHPLAMRVVLSKLEKMSAAKVLQALRSNIAELGLNPEKESESRVFATLRFVEQGLAEELRPLLGLVGLHESYLDAYYMEHMAIQVDPAWTRPLIDRLMSALVAAGLLQELVGAQYELHPLLTSYLHLVAPASEACTRAFTEIMSVLADQVAPAQEHELRAFFYFHGANFYAALRLAEVYAEEDRVESLTQLIAAFAQNSRDFAQATVLHRKRAEQSLLKKDWEGAAVSYHQLGRVAEEERKFEAAREWYLKALAIGEREHLLQAAAASYHQLGMVAQEEKKIALAQDYYRKSLEISERQGDLRGTARTYHQMGRVAEEERKFKAARKWYLKSLDICEKLGNLDGASSSYHHLGTVAQEEREFKAAREWYAKSLEIEERHGNLQGIAKSCFQLGRVAEEERNFDAARKLILKSLAINEKQGNLHSAALDYNQLGVLAARQGDTIASAAWLVRGIKAFLEASDPRLAHNGGGIFLLAHQHASPEEAQKMEAIWHEAGLGPFPAREKSTGQIGLLRRGLRSLGIGNLH